MNKNIKNFGAGILAAAFGLAIVFTGSAFKTEKVKTDSYTFYYNGPALDKTNVENESNWVYDNDDLVCNETNQRACTIQVSESFVNTTLATPTLKSITNLGAEVHVPSGTAFITGSADGSMLIFNRGN